MSIIRSIRAAKVESRLFNKELEETANRIGAIVGRINEVKLAAAPPVGSGAGGGGGGSSFSLGTTRRPDIEGPVGGATPRATSGGGGGTGGGGSSSFQRVTSGIFGLTDRLEQTIRRGPLTASPGEREIVDELRTLTRILRGSVPGSGGDGGLDRRADAPL